MSWFMCAWSLITMYLMSEKKYRMAWIWSIFSQVGWAYVSYDTKLWGMLMYCTIMLGIGIRALYRLEKLNT